MKMIFKSLIDKFSVNSLLTEAKTQEIIEKLNNLLRSLNTDDLCSDSCLFGQERSMYLTWTKRSGQNSISEIEFSPDLGKVWIYVNDYGRSLYSFTSNKEVFALLKKLNTKDIKFYLRVELDVKEQVYPCSFADCWSCGI